MFAWFLLSGSLCFFTNAHLIDAFCPEFEPNFGSTNDSLLWFDELPRPKMLVWHVVSFVSRGRTFGFLRKRVLDFLEFMQLLYKSFQISKTFLISLPILKTFSILIKNQPFQPSTFRIQTYFTPVVYGFYFVASLFIGWLTMRALEKEFQSISINETVRKVQRQLSGLLFAQVRVFSGSNKKNERGGRKVWSINRHFS